MTHVTLSCRPLWKALCHSAAAVAGCSKPEYVHTIRADQSVARVLCFFLLLACEPLLLLVRCLVSGRETTCPTNRRCCPGFNAIHSFKNVSVPRVISGSSRKARGEAPPACNACQSTSLKLKPNGFFCSIQDMHSPCCQGNAEREFRRRSLCH